jgi:hypothetical protein
MCLATYKCKEKEMSSFTEVSVKVNLVHGEQLEFALERDEQGLRNAGSNIENTMKSNYVGVELEDSLTLIPLQNIATIEISPAPKMLVQHVVKGARRVT